MLVDLPDDVLLHVLGFLRLASVIALRETCRRLHNLTHDKTTWLRFLNTQRSILPLSSSFRDQSSSPDYILSLTLKALEKTVLSNHQIACSWLRRRQIPYQSLPKLGQSLLNLQLFMDKWLFVLYAEGQVYVWNIEGTTAAARVVNSFDLGCKGWSSSAAAIDDQGKNITLAVTRSGGPVPTITVLYNIPLSSSPPTLLHTLHNLYALTTRAVIPGANVLLMAHSSRVLIVRWQAESHASSTVFVEPTTTVWEGTVAIQYCDPYLLLVRSQSIELHPLPPPSGTTPTTQLPILKYFINRSSLSEASISAPVISSSEHCDQDAQTASSKTISLSVLAYDVLRVYYYDVSIHLPPPGPLIPSLDVHLSRVSHHPGSAYISSLAFGPQGRRGLWVERTRERNLRRTILVFNHPPDDDTEEDAGAENGVIDRHVALSFDMIDMREELTMCTLGEVSGKIVLGTRSGDVRVLNPV